MTHADFKTIVISALRERIKEPGASLYSSFNTVRKGKLYILGLNPGGDHSMTVEQSIDKIADSGYNEYLEEWVKNKPGEHPLQRNVKEITRLFGLRTHDVCASNLIFTRSIGQQGANYGSRHDFWPIHEEILKIVQPEVIIAFGNGSISPYQHLLQISTRVENKDSVESGHGKYTCVSFKGKILNRSVTVIGLPHLSRYHLYTNNPAKKHVLSWMKSKE